MLEKFPQILVIPIDNRPVCSDLVQDSAAIFDSAKVFMPDVSLLGGLEKKADNEKLFGWIKHTLISNDIDIVILSLDTIAYGGLVASRRTSVRFEEIKKNIDAFIELINSIGKKVKIYAYSTIMRISDNNCNEEEKTYWDAYGKDLFRYSYFSHKLLKDYDVEIEDELIQLSKKIPFEVIEDYLDTRKRNYEINSYYIDLVKNGVFDRLVFSQDDTGEYGFNVEEKELLQKQALRELVQDKVTFKTGADEMSLALLSASLVEFLNEELKIHPLYFAENSKKIISRYEDTTIEKSVNATIKICGAKVAESFDDINLLINAPNRAQDEICLEIFEDEVDNSQADKIIEFATKTPSKYFVADIKKANGADNYLLNDFMNIDCDDEKFYGFAAWNTTGNTLGTVIAIGIIKFLAKKYNVYNEQAFKKVEYIRLLDDWAYQANVRKIIRQNKSEEKIFELMQPYCEKVAKFLNFNPTVSYEFPWNRTFEVKINI